MKLRCARPGSPPRGFPRIPGTLEPFPVPRSPPPMRPIPRPSPGEYPTYGNRATVRAPAWHIAGHERRHLAVIRERHLGLPQG